MLIRMQGSNYYHSNSVRDDQFCLYCFHDRDRCEGSPISALRARTDFYDRLHLPLPRRRMKRSALYLQRFVGILLQPIFEYPPAAHLRALVLVAGLALRGGAPLLKLRQRR